MFERRALNTCNLLTKTFIIWLIIDQITIIKIRSNKVIKDFLERTLFNFLIIQILFILLRFFPWYVVWNLISCLNILLNVLAMSLVNWCIIRAIFKFWWEDCVLGYSRADLQASFIFFYLYSLVLLERSFHFSTIYILNSLIS